MSDKIENNNEEEQNNVDRDLSAEEFHSMMGSDDVEVIEENDDDYDPYLEDDLKRLNSDDEIIDRSDFSAIIDQYDGIVTWRIEGYMDQDTGEILSPSKMRNDPPTLVVENNTGDVINFKLTKELSKTLSDSLEDIYERMSGVKRTSRSSDKEIIEWFKENKIKTGLVIVTLLFFIYMIVI